MERSYTQRTIKILFGRATHCGYPGCTVALVFEDRGRLSVVAEIAHIRSAAPNGPRFDPGFPIGKLNEEGNLLLLCGTHHKHVDEHETAYPIAELVEWKEKQVTSCANRKISDDLASRIVKHYDLVNLGPEGFERMCQALAVNVLGPNTILHTGPGPDGRRDASLVGRTAGYPSTDQAWDGYTVLQAMHSSRSSGQAENYLLQRIRADLEFWAHSASTGDGKTPDYLIFATNLSLSRAVGGRFMSSVEAMVMRFHFDFPLRDWAIWDEQYLTLLLDTYPSIRTAFSNLYYSARSLLDE